MIIQQTKLLLGHIRNKDETGKLLISELEYTKIVSGIGKPILHKNTDIHFIQWTPPTWIKNYKKLLHSTKGTVHIANQCKPTTQRKMDIFLMDSFYEYTTDTNTPQLLNNCKLYLQALTLSDIASVGGKQILKYPLTGQKTPSHTSTLTWPKQKKPNQKTRQLSAMIIKHHFCQPNSLILKTPLGP